MESLPVPAATRRIREFFWRVQELGFQPFLAPQRQSPIITTFRYLEHPRFAFKEFYQRLSDRGFVIYPGELTDSDCFRIGTIGHIFSKDVRALLDAVQGSLEEMGICSPKGAARA